MKPRPTFFKENIYAAARIIGCSYDELVDALASQIRQGFTIASNAPVDYPTVPEGGVRCRHSEAGLRELNPRDPNRCGWLLGPVRKQPDMVKVVWDGGGVPQYYHKDFIAVSH